MQTSRNWCVATPSGIVGRAVHPTQEDYGVTVSLVSGDRVISTSIAEQQFEELASRLQEIGRRVVPYDPPERQCYFKLEVSAEVGEDWEVVVGETDETIGSSGHASAAVTSIKDLLGRRFRRRWVRGFTWRDAKSAGSSDKEILWCLYVDILGREPDPAGADFYLSELANGGMTFDGVRRRLISSEEYRARVGVARAAPGSIFSNKLIWMT